MNYNLGVDVKPELDEELAHSVEEPKLKLMSEGENEAFLKEIFANVDKVIENMWPGLGK